MPVVAFMSYGGALLFMMALAAGVTLYVEVFRFWLKSRATWAASVLVVVPAVLVIMILRELRDSRKEPPGTQH